MKNYQRRYLRAPYREAVLISDSHHVFKAKCINLSEGGLLLDEIPVFPQSDTLNLFASIPQIPSFKNFTLLNLQTFSKDLFKRRVVMAKAKMVRREQLSQNLDNIFSSRFGIEFVAINQVDQKVIEDYVLTFSSNLIFLQTLVDTYNFDADTRLKLRCLAGIMGYEANEKLSQLRAQIAHDYKSLQWL